jgi:chromosome segregation ATPase
MVKCKTYFICYC